MDHNNKYQVLLQQQQVGIDSIIKHYAEAIQFKKSQAKINHLISLQDTQQAQKQDLRQMKRNIQVALQQQISTLRAKQKQIDAYPLSLQLLTAHDVGKLAKCFLKQQRKWKNSVVLQVDDEQQTAKVKRYGANQISQFPAYFLKVLKQPDQSLFQQGTHCKAIYSADGQFYPCIIQKVLEQGYLVKYKKYNTQQIVKLHRLRPAGNQPQKVQQVKFQKLDQFVVPQKLKILPNDPQNVKKNKKTKIKALKFAFKNAKVEQINKQKQDKWKNWNSGINNPQKSGYFKTKYDVDVFHTKKQ